MQNIPTKNTGDSLTAAEFNDIPDELENAITSAGITLSGADVTQLAKAIAHYVGNSSFYTDTGVADAYVATVIGTNKAPPAYVDGMVVEFKIGNTNTGASTINVDGLGVKNITGTAAAGDLTAGNFIKLRFNIGSGEFDILVNGAFDVSKFLRNDQSGILTGDLVVTGELFVAGGASVAYTSLDQIVIGEVTGDHGIVIQAAPTGIAALTFGDGAIAGRLLYDFTLDDLSIVAAGLTQLKYDSSASLWDFQANDITTTGTITGAPPAVGSVGSYALLRKETAGAVAEGGTIAGADLRFSSAGAVIAGTPTGTWRVMGNQSGTNSVTLMLRIS
jgi:hypothetical protein